MLRRPQSALHPSGPSPQGRLESQSAKWKKNAASIVRQVHTLTLVLRHPGVPWSAKAAAGCAVAYLFSPVQLIPTFIPVIGQMDDLLVLYIGMKIVRKRTPLAILTECETRAVHFEGPKDEPALTELGCDPVRSRGSRNGETLRMSAGELSSDA